MITQQWQAISSAPENGAKFWVCNISSGKVSIPWIGYFERATGQWMQKYLNDQHRGLQPTHWMPIKKTDLIRHILNF